MKRAYEHEINIVSGLLQLHYEYGNLGNFLGSNSQREPNKRNLKLLDLANDFNLCPINLMRDITLLLITFCACLLSSIKTAATFEVHLDNTSHYRPIQTSLFCNFALCDGNL